MHCSVVRRQFLGFTLLSAACSSTFAQEAATMVQKDAAQIGHIQKLREAYLLLQPQHVFKDVPSAVLEHARALLQSNGVALHNETFMLVDRSDTIQHAWIILVENDQWHVVADGPISSGQTQRKGYFYTPVGVFEHRAEILGYRAQGTKNSNGVRGLGIKGMRIWDFGWTPSYTGWLKTNEPRDIRFQIHATDPDVLERRLGKPASKGCIRVSTSMNMFLDRYSILDKNVLQFGNPRALSTLHRQRVEHDRAGRFLIVVDSRQNTPKNTPF